MKKILAIFSILLIINVYAFSLEDNYKVFSYDADTIFLNSINAINSSKKFEISEIQTKNGYILFSYENKFYLLTVTKKYQKQTEIKILPQNSDYSDEGEVAKMLFSLIDYQLKFNPMEQIK